MDEHLERSQHLIYYQVSGELGIAGCSCLSDIYLSYAMVLESLTFTLYECEAHSHLSYHCETHSQVCYGVRFPHIYNVTTNAQASQKFWSRVKIGTGRPKLAAKIGPPLPKMVRMHVLHS